MSEPLFLQSVMQEKIWGGAKLRDEFGYDIPSEKSENIGPSQPIQMESLKLPMVVTREQILLLCMRNTVNYLAIVQNLYFHF